MHPSPVHSRSIRNTLVCPVCQKQFYAYRSDKKTCSARCKHKLQLQVQQTQAAGKMREEVKELYQTYELTEKTNNERIIF